MPHKSLRLKLEICGISGALLKWFKSFLCDRRQHVVVNGSTSDWSPVLSGVPQGPILGPLLFILYLPNNLQCVVKMFADDVAIYKSIATREDCDLLQRDLSLISSWCQDGLMNLNPSKCEALCISNKKSFFSMFTIFVIALCIGVLLQGTLVLLLILSLTGILTVNLLLQRPSGF